MQGSKTIRRSRIWLGLFTVLFLLLSCLTVAYFGYRQHLEESALSVLTDEERAAFREWLQTPITPDAEALEPLPPLDEDLIAEKDRFLEYAKDTRNSFVSEMRSPDSTTGLSLQDKLRKWASLSAHELDIVTSFTSAVKPLVVTGIALTNNPNYTLESRTFPHNGTDFFAYETYVELFYFYACATAQAGSWGDSVEALALLASLLKVEDRGGNYRENEVHLWVRGFTGSLSDRTSNTEVLTQFLDIGLAARAYVKYAASEKSYDSEVINNTRNMLIDRYIRYTPQTRYEHYELILTVRDYYQWVVDGQTTSAPEKSAQAAQLVRDMDSFYPDEPPVVRLRKWSAGMPQLIRRPLYFSGNYPKLVNRFKYYLSWKSGAWMDLAKYDLQCLKLVRRISELKGLSKNGADLELVETYMGGVPPDPFGSAPLQYNLEKQAYFSVGPDGVSGSSDDIYDQ